MAPPLTTQDLNNQNPKPDCPANSKSSESFNFVDGSTFAAGFNYSKSGQEHTNELRRPRPRMKKLRRKQAVLSQNGRFVESELGLNGTGDASEETRIDFGVSFGKATSNVSGKGGDLDGNVSQFGDSDRGGLGFGAGFNGSRPGFGVGGVENTIDSSLNRSGDVFRSKDSIFIFSGDKSSTKLGVEKESEGFVFGATKDGLKNSLNGNCVNSGNKNGLSADTNSSCEYFVFGAVKSESRGIPKSGVEESAENMSQPKATDTFSGSDKYDPVSNEKLDPKGVKKPDGHSNSDEFGKVNGTGFVIGACKNASMPTNSNSQGQESGNNAGQNASRTDASRLVPNMSGKVETNTFGDSKKVHHPCFQFSAAYSNDHVKFVFGSSANVSKSGFNLQKNTTDNSSNQNRFQFTNGGVHNPESETQFRSACSYGAFVFGGSDFDGDDKPLKDRNQLNMKNTDNSNGLEEHKHYIGSEVEFDSKISSDSGGSFENRPASNLSEEMKKLSVEDSEAYGGNLKSFSSNFSMGIDTVFVFESNHKASSFVKQAHPADINGKTPDVSDFPKNDTETYRTTSSSFATPSMKKGEKDNINVTHNLNGLDSPGAAFSPPILKFDFSNIFTGTHKPDHSNIRSLRTRRLKKKTEKLRQRTMVKQFFGQDTVKKEDSFQKNVESPEHGSPMDLSPYQETNSCNTPAAAADQKDGQHGDNTNGDMSNLNSSPSLPAESGLSSIARLYKKKYKLKVGPSHKVQFNNLDKEKSKQGPEVGTLYEVSDHWRIRGNQAYQAGNFSEAEEFYTLGINGSLQYRNTLDHSTEPLLLCYSNRAATRMTLGRMREAIEDCKMASALDPNFLKAVLRAGNCYLLLGEVEDAIECFSKCLGSETEVCLDRRFKIEAADGLQKAKSVAEKMNQSSKLLQERTVSAADSAVGKITEALSISRYSESLLKMKGEALCILRKFDEVIQLCDQTLDAAKRNLAADQLGDPRYKNSCELWRRHLLIKSHYHIGKLDKALDLIEQENIPLSSTPGNMTEESSTDLVITIRQLLCLKKSGNEAFRSGKFTEAIEHYTAAITKSVDSRPFMAICFCNRAAAYQSINQVIDAILDCSLAISLDENYQKAISRRATLHEMIRDYKQVAEDLQRLISLLEKQLTTKNQQSDSQSKSSGGTGRDLRKARRRLSTIEEKVKKEIPMDFYLILGIKTTDTESEIKKAYRKAALKHHPDKAGQALPRSDVGDDGTFWKEVSEKIHNDADRLFKIIGEAYSVLSDSSKRSTYDSEEDMRNLYRESNRNNNSGHQSTSYSSPHARGDWSGKSSNFNSSFGRNNRRHWYEPRSYSGYSHSRW